MKTLHSVVNSHTHTLCYGPRLESTLTRLITRPASEGRGNNTSSQVTRENLKYWALWCTLALYSQPMSLKKYFHSISVLGGLQVMAARHGGEVFHSGTATVDICGGGAENGYSCTVAPQETQNTSKLWPHSLQGPYNTRVARS